MAEEWEGFSSNDERNIPTTKPFTGVSKQANSAAIIDMGNVDDDSTTSSFEYVGDQSPQHRKKADNEQGSNGADITSGLGGNLGKVVADQMWESGQQQARKMFTIYGNIDVLRPYFDVDVRTLLVRIASSFVPVRSISKPQKIPNELYGPLMTVLTLIAILLLNMKHSDTVMVQGTLMGTAFGICFGYWLGVSGFMYFIAYICNTYISVVQCLSLLGYGMVSHCVILLLGHITHYSHGFFYLLWAVVAGASAARMITVLLSRTLGKSQRLMLCLSIASFHMLFLLYLHFAYHKVIEGFVESLDVKPAHAEAPIVSKHELLKKKVEDEIDAHKS